MRSGKGGGSTHGKLAKVVWLAYCEHNRHLHFQVRRAVKKVELTKLAILQSSVFVQGVGETLRNACARVRECGGEGQLRGVANMSESQRACDKHDSKESAVNQSLASSSSPSKLWRDAIATEAILNPAFCARWHSPSKGEQEAKGRCKSKCRCARKKKAQQRDTATQHAHSNIVTASIRNLAGQNERQTYRTNARSMLKQPPPGGGEAAHQQTVRRPNQRRTGKLWEGRTDKQSDLRIILLRAGKLERNVRGARHSAEQPRTRRQNY